MAQERVAALTQLAAALEAGVIDTALTLLDRALEGVYTELNSESLAPGSREEDALRLAVRLRPQLALIAQQLATLVFKLRVLANQNQKTGVEVSPELQGYTWD